MKRWPKIFTQKETDYKHASEDDDAILHLIFDMVPDLVCVATFDGYFKKLNPSWKTVLGWSENELKQKPFIDFVHPEDMESTSLEMSAIISENEMKAFVNRYRCKDGTFRWLEWRYKAIAGRNEVYAVARDITERTVAGQELLEAEEKYDAAFKTSQDAINLNKLDGTFVDINEGFSKISGYTKEEVIGLRSTRLGIWADPGSRARMIEILNREGSVKNFDTNFRCKDGSCISGSFSACIVRYQNEPHILSVTRDITRQVMADRALRESEEKYRLLAVNSSDVIWTADLKGNLSYVSPSVERALGYTADEVVGMGVEGITSPEAAIMVRQLFSTLVQSVQKGSQVSMKTFTLEHRSKSGTIIWSEMKISPLMNDDHKLIGFLGISRNITERKHTEQILISRMAAVESASDAIGISDAQGCHIYQNGAMTKLFGYSTAEEFQSSGGWKACVPEKVDSMKIYENLINGMPWKGEAEMMDKNGRHFKAFVRADAIKDGNGDFLGLVGIITDITDRVLIEEKLRNSEEIFRSLAEYSPSMIFIIIKQRIYYVNQLCEMKLGYSKEELYAPDFDILDLAAPEHREMMKENLEGYYCGKEPEPYEFLMKSKEGRKLYTMVNNKLIQIGGENAVLGVIIDLSEQRWAEEMLKRKATQFENFTKLMVDRELKLVELKKEVNELAQKLGEESRYQVFGGNDTKNVSN